MKQTGFVRITMGLEAGNQEMLDRIRKGTKLEQYENAYCWMRELDLETRGSFIIGSPHETAETIEDSIRFAKKLPLYRVGVNILTPYPGTELCNKAVSGNDGVRLLCRDWRLYKSVSVSADTLVMENIDYDAPFVRCEYTPNARQTINVAELNLN